MRRNMIIAIMIGALWASEACAMLQLKAKAQKSDTEANTEFALAKDHARLSGTINDLYNDLSVEGTLEGFIPLNNVTKSEVEALLNGENYEYILNVHRAYNQADPAVIRSMSREERTKRSKIQAHALRAMNFSVQKLKDALSYLKAAHFLDIPELIEKYAHIMADMLCSEASLRLLQANDQAHTKMIGEINKKRDLADLIMQYISTDVWGEDWKLAGGAERFFLPRFSPDCSKVLLLGDKYRRVKVFDVKSGVLLWELVGHRDRIGSAAFSADGNKIVTASWDGTARTWNAHSGMVEIIFKPHDNNKVTTALFSADGNRLLTAGNDGTAKIWNINIPVNQNPTLLRTFSVAPHCFDEGCVVYIAAFSPVDQNVVMTASYLGYVQIWDVNTSRELHRYNNKSAVYSASFSPDGKRVVTGVLAIVKIWDIDTNEVIPLKPWADNSVVYSPIDNNKILVSNTSDTVEIWNVKDNALINTLRVNDKGGHKAVFSPDGKKIIIANPRRSVASLWTILPASDMQQALFLQYLQFNNNQGKQGGWESGWGRTVMDTYEPDEKAMIKRAFPKETVMQKIESYLNVN